MEIDCPHLTVGFLSYRDLHCIYRIGFSQAIAHAERYFQPQRKRESKGRAQEESREVHFVQNFIKKHIRIEQCLLKPFVLLKSTYKRLKVGLLRCQKEGAPVTYFPHNIRRYMGMGWNWKSTARRIGFSTRWDSGLLSVAQCTVLDTV